MRQARPWTAALQAVVLVVASLAVCAVVGEVALRLFWGGFYEKFDPERPLGEFGFHPARGLMPAPGTETYRWNRDYQFRQRNNSLGFRGEEIGSKAPGRFRILALGDSQTYGTGVADDGTYPAVMQQLDPSLEVINAGAPGYGPDREWLLLEEHIAGIRPDLVTVGYFWNDLSDVGRCDYTCSKLEGGRVRFVPPEPASLEHPAFAARLAKYQRRVGRYGWLRLESRLYRFLSDRLKLLDYATRELRGRGDRNEVDPADTAADEERAWQHTWLLLRMMRDLSREHGAGFAILVIPDQVQVEPDVVVYGIPDFLHRIQDRLRDFGGRAGIPVIDPLAALRAARERNGAPLYHPFDRHLNTSGQRALATVFLEELRRLELVRTARG